MRPRAVGVWLATTNARDDGLIARAEAAERRAAELQSVINCDVAQLRASVITLSV
jgi:hypothetical protein